MTLTIKQKHFFLMLASGILGAASTAIGKAYPEYAEPAHLALFWAGMLLGLPMQMPGTVARAIEPTEEIR